jgi:ribonucleotide reductase alpha subunit
MEAWKRGCKGCTTYRTGGSREGILVETPAKQEVIACEYDPLTGQKTCE